MHPQYAPDTDPKKFNVFIGYYETVEKHVTLKLSFNRGTSKRLVNWPVSVLKEHFLQHCKDSGIGSSLRPDECHLVSTRGALADDDLIGTYVCRREELKLVHGMPPSRGHFPTRSVWCWGSCFGKGTVAVPALVASLERRQVTQIALGWLHAVAVTEPGVQNVPAQQTLTPYFPLC